MGCVGSAGPQKDAQPNVTAPQVIGQCDEEFVADALEVLRGVGVAASRTAVDKDIIQGLSEISKKNPNIYSESRACFFDFIDHGSVNMYGSGIVYFQKYYEFWFIPAGRGKSARLCAGANPDGWDAGSLTDTAHPRAAVIPEGYPDTGPAREVRFRPVCRSEKENYVGYL
jgi:hypothetical protein